MDTNRAVDVKTVVHELDPQRPEMMAQQDKELARLRNGGWHFAGRPTVTSTFDPSRNGIVVHRVITLERQCLLLADGTSGCEEAEFVEELLREEREQVGDAPAAPQPEPPAQHGRKRVTGTIHRQPKGDRKPVDEVSWAEAFASGQYSSDELKKIGNREAFQAGIQVVFERQQARSGQTWEGAVLRLGAPGKKQ